ncbi:MAG TPA: VWA domain-containing protein [Vicinamibacterales bacterium]
MASHSRFRSAASALVAIAIGTSLTVAATRALLAQQQTAGPQRPTAVFRSGVDIVTVNVVVRDRNGNVVRGLTRDDFVVIEDGKPQPISTFDFEEIATQAMEVAPAAMPTVFGSVGRAPSVPVPAPETKPAIDMHGRRLIAMLFDLSSMQPEEIMRSAASAREYIEKRLTPADMVAIATLSTTLQVPQDFTGDRDLLLKVLDRLSGVEGQGFEEAVAADPTDESATAFAADDSEFTLFNTDRRLRAIQALTEAMAPIEQKKSLIYFSSGMTQTGLDNRVAIRTVIDRAVRSNVSIYTADMRGLQALGPAGDASQASTRGQSAFSGRAASARFDTMSSSQDALSSLAEDTGGRAFFDQNDFRSVFDRVVADTSAYYLLGFSSTNRSLDGRFRRIRVSVKRPDLKLEYRAGYYAPRDFAHSGRDDREQQLTEQLFSDLSVTDLPVYASSAYFRIKGDRYFVPLWVVVPGSNVPFNRSRDKNSATLDVLAVVRDSQQRPVARIRDTVNLSVSATEDVQRKNVQYQTDLELPPGLFQLKVVVRENQTGNMGSFEAAIAVPDLGRSPVRISSVVVGSRLQAGMKKDPRNPLLQNGQELIPSIAHVVAAGQPLYLYYEMYDAAPAAPAPAGRGDTRPAAAAGPGIRVVSNVVFFRGQTRVFETSLVEAAAVSAPDRKATTFQLEVPTTDLPPGLYTCQVNVIDDVAGTFAFPRLAIYVRR